MTCKCEDHSQHSFRLNESENRHDAHDAMFTKVWEYFETKVSRGAMVFLFASIFLSLLLQTSAYLLAQKTDKNVAVLTARVNSHFSLDNKKVINLDQDSKLPNPLISTAHASTGE